MADTVRLGMDEATALCERAALAAGAEPGGGGIACQIRRRSRSERAQGGRPLAFPRLSRRAPTPDASTAMPSPYHQAGARPSMCRTPRAGWRIRASTASATRSPSRRGSSASRSSRSGTPTPAASSAISPAGWPARGWSPSPRPTARRCLRAPARPSPSIAPTRCPSQHQSRAERRWSSTSRRARRPSSASARRRRRGARFPPAGRSTPTGKPTTDPAAAMKGALLAFGGNRGANIALMVEVLAAGLSGANWSLDAPSISEGPESPGTGLFVLAIEPKYIAPGLRHAGFTNSSTASPSTIASTFRASRGARPACWQGAGMTSPPTRCGASTPIRQRPKTHVRRTRRPSADAGPADLRTALTCRREPAISRDPVVK